MKLKLYLCAPNKLAQTTKELAARIESVVVGDLQFEVLSAVTHTPQHLSPERIFSRNVELIRSADYFIAVFDRYGKDLTAEVGMAYGMCKPIAGIDYDANPNDIMSFYAAPIMIAPTELEGLIERWLRTDTRNKLRNDI